MIKSKKIIISIFFILINVVSNGQSLKLMTYNIRLDISSDGQNNWTHRKSFCMGQIQFYDPDIFGVQEAKPNQVIDIATKLPQYDSVGIGREGIGKGESSAIYYKKERFEIIQANTFWLSETPNEISRGCDAAYNRVCTYALLKDSQTKQLVWVFNTHLDHLGNEARSKGIELILSKIASLNAKGYPVIFMGDFNSEPQEERIIALKKVMDDCSEVSQETPFGPSATFNDFNYNTGATRRIDYIFISKKGNLKVKKYAVLTDAINLHYPSDHFPVYVEINFK